MALTNLGPLLGFYLLFLELQELHENFNRLLIVFNLFPGALERMLFGHF